MKTKLMMILALVSLSNFAFANGLYIVSGFDARTCNIRYVIETTNDNQSVELTPQNVRLLSVYDNPSYAGPWSVKTEGVEFEFTKYDVIRQGNGDIGESIGSKGCTNIAPFIHTYPYSGQHKVKVFDVKNNIYQIRFENPDMVELFIDWRSIPSQYIFDQLTIGFGNNPKLKKIVFGMPTSYNSIKFPSFRDMPLLEDVTFLNPIPYTSIPSKAFQNLENLTNEFNFVNVTNIESSAFAGCVKIKHMSFPNVVNIRTSAFNILSVASASNGKGLHSIRLGDCLESVGMNAFYGNINLKTVEFVTDSNDWISAWNNHAIFPNLFGSATGESSSDVAQITPFSSYPTEYYSNARFCKPTVLVRVRRTELSSN